MALRDLRIQNAAFPTPGIGAQRTLSKTCVSPPICTSYEKRTQYCVVFFLQGSDPSTYEMIQKIQTLQRRLIQKTEEVSNVWLFSCCCCCCCCLLWNKRSCRTDLLLAGEHVIRMRSLGFVGPVFLNAVYFRRGLTCTLGLTNDLIDGGQPRAKNSF